MKILVIGCTGMLGSNFFLMKNEHEIYGTYYGKKPLSKCTYPLNICEEKQIIKVMDKIKPDVIYHTAAITNVDLCERNPSLARKVHVEGTKNLLKCAKEYQSFFIYVSTDSVFDGTKGNYSERDVPNPLNVYAKTKYEGEQIVSTYSNSCICRTNIYGFNWLNKQSIAEWIINSLTNKNKINLFEDVFFTPIFTSDYNRLILDLIKDEVKGLFHVSGSESISKLCFGKNIAQIFNLDEKLINPISIKSLNLKAKRPLNPTLNCSKIEKKLEIKLPDILEGLNHYKTIKNSSYLARLKNL